MLENIPRVNEIETFGGESQMMRIALDVQNGGRLYTGLDLGCRSFNPHNLHVRRRSRNRCGQQSKTATHLQNTHAGMDIEEFDECLVG
jgi:hypothetical protein